MGTQCPLRLGSPPQTPASRLFCKTPKTGLQWHHFSASNRACGWIGPPAEHGWDPDKQAGPSAEHPRRQTVLLTGNLSSRERRTPLSVVPDYIDICIFHPPSGHTSAGIGWNYINIQTDCLILPPTRLQKTGGSNEACRTQRIPKKPHAAQLITGKPEN